MITPTQRQLEVLRVVWLTGSQKQAAPCLEMKPRTVEYHLSTLRRQLGMRGASLIDLMRWGVMSGLLTILLLLPIGARQMPGPASVTLGWNPDPGAGVYKLQWVAGGQTNSAMTFGTKITVSGLSGQATYAFNVFAAAATNQVNNLWSKPSNTVLWRWKSNLPTTGI